MMMDEVYIYTLLTIGLSEQFGYDAWRALWSVTSTVLFIPILCSS